MTLRLSAMTAWGTRRGQRGKRSLQPAPSYRVVLTRANLRRSHNNTKVTKHVVETHAIILSGSLFAGLFHAFDEVKEILLWFAYLLIQNFKLQ